MKILQAICKSLVWYVAAWPTALLIHRGEGKAIQKVNEQSCHFQMKMHSLRQSPANNRMGKVLSLGGSEQPGAAWLALLAFCSPQPC